MSETVTGIIVERQCSIDRDAEIQRIIVAYLVTEVDEDGYSRHATVRRTIDVDAATWRIALLGDEYTL